MKLAYTTRVGYICVYTPLERPGICNDPPTLTSTHKEESSGARPATLPLRGPVRKNCTAPHCVTQSSVYARRTLRSRPRKIPAGKPRSAVNQLAGHARTGFFPGKTTTCATLPRVCRESVEGVPHYFRALRRHRGRSVLLHPGRRPVVRVCDCATCTTELCSR